MKRLLTLLIWVLLSTATASTGAQNSLRVGVLAFRPKAQATDQWQPLASYLATALNRTVVLTTYDLPELDAAVAANAIDVVFTTPGHFIALQRTHRLSAPLATQVTLHQDAELSAFGGVVFTRADNATIQTLADLARTRIAVTSTAFLGGYQMQAVELLEAGLALPQPEQLVATGMPQDRVVEAVLAVLAGQVDVGFVRTGVLEAMAREGTLALNRDDLTVVFSEVGHRHWLRSLEAYLAGQVGHPPMMGAADCHFGRWQVSEGESRFGHLPLFSELVVLHNYIHATGQALVGQFSAGQVAKAQTGLDNLRPLATQLNRTLRELIHSSDDTAASVRVL